MVDRPLVIVGSVASPYSRKLRAVLRYRRIPHRWILQGSSESRGLPEPPVALLPRLITTDADGNAVARIDSTPIIRELETVTTERSVTPSDPVVAFVDELLEDYADEWLTKAMFHYRWSFAPDISRAAAILPRWGRTEQPDEQARAAGRAFADRQVGRLAVVGSNPTTAAVIEQSYRRLLALLDSRLGEARFVMGDRPGVCDFALYGQLTQLVGFDPTPAAIALETTPRVVAWVDAVDDLSGLEPGGEQWLERDRVAEALGPLLAEVGRTYVPFLVANAQALATGAECVETTIDGRPWVQRPFAYQAKCLRWLRESHERLAARDRAALDPVLQSSGCGPLLAD